MILIWPLLIYFVGDWNPNDFKRSFQEIASSGAGAGAVARRHANRSRSYSLIVWTRMEGSSSPLDKSAIPGDAIWKEGNSGNDLLCTVEGYLCKDRHPCTKNDANDATADRIEATSNLSTGRQFLTPEGRLVTAHEQETCTHSDKQAPGVTESQPTAEEYNLGTGQPSALKNPDDGHKLARVQSLRLGTSGQSDCLNSRISTPAGEGSNEEPMQLKKEKSPCNQEHQVTSDPSSEKYQGRDISSSNFCMSLRHWLSNSDRVVDKVENLHIFRQIAEFVELAHSQGVVLRNIRPSSFLLSSLSRVSIIDSASSPTSSGSSEESTGRAAQQRWEGLQELPLANDNKIHATFNAAPNTTPAETVEEYGNKEESSAIPSWGIRMEAADMHQTSKPDSATYSHLHHQASRISGVGVSVQNEPECMQSDLKLLAERGSVETDQEGKDRQSISDNEGVQLPEEKFPLKRILSMEQLWYKSPEELSGSTTDFSSDVYSLGVLFLELFYRPASEADWARAMSDLRHRLLPPELLLQYPKEAAFCLLLLHPNPSFRPKAREVLHADIFSEVGDKLAEREALMNLEGKITEAEITMDFLLKVQQEKNTMSQKLSQELEYLKADVEEVERWQQMLNTKLQAKSMGGPHSCTDKHDLLGRELVQEGVFEPGSNSMDNLKEEKHQLLLAKSAQLMQNFSSLKKIYFSMMNKMNLHAGDSSNYQRQSLKSEKQESSGFSGNNGKSGDHLTQFFDNLCKFIGYTRFEVKAALQYGDFLNTGNMVCSVDFDCDGEFFATAGVCKKIKIFDFCALLEESLDIYYPVIEMTSRRKLSCVTWNNFQKNQLASSDLEGAVQLWDITAGQGVMELKEHDRCAWSVDFSRVDPLKLASGSDDYCVKLWSMNQSRSTGTIKTKANVCCVQFSPASSHLLAFGSADSNVYCYDLRQMKNPMHILTGHQKAVSFVRFAASTDLVSASTDSTLKLWDLTRSNTIAKGTSLKTRSQSACITTFKGHHNEKNFVGLTVTDAGYIACGSETNEVFVYHKSLPMAMLSYKFGHADPLSGQEIEASAGQFVSSVCWREKSQTLVAANSVGNIKVLEMV